jgi:hypothetical protein
VNSAINERVNAFMHQAPAGRNRAIHNPGSAIDYSPFTIHNSPSPFSRPSMDEWINDSISQLKKSWATPVGILSLDNALPPC